MERQKIRHVKAWGRNKSYIAEFTQIRPLTNVFFHFLLFIFAASCIIPVLLIISISVSDENFIQLHGYSLIPKQVSLKAYTFIFMKGSEILNSLFNSVLVTAAGTALSIFLTTTMGYVLSRYEYRLHKFYSWLMFLPMVFGGGMVASYFINTQFLHFHNTLWILFVPGAMGTFNCIICRTFFRSNVPDAIVDSAKMDGASQFTIFFRLIMPVSLPLIATIGLFASFGLWNDWFTPFLYIGRQDLYTLQALLYKYLRDIQKLTENLSVSGVSALEMALKLPKEGARMAIVVLVVVPITCVYPFFQRYFITGLTIGAVKE
ncbi:MAG: carbohydrate ABC transporter permease [Treponema sp.]|jgi:putative aldouronate transport system permease protein|nr:carbohydrate ABC transporter permease [Treponema sp.]